MKVPSARSVTVVALAPVCAVSVLACGASINAVYEGDVRFEHCMALDSHSGEKSTIQLSCWDEWVKYYTFGQTRDRVEYARRRQRELSGESDFQETSAPSVVAQRAVPEPTNVLAPPPMMFGDAGAPADAAPPDASAKPEDAEPPAAACAAQCRDAWTPCKQACTTAACEKTCEKTYKRCMKKCF
ncbi:MAG: hypothetical protein U0441_38570 [Polyangiaceae bacterium]